MSKISSVSKWKLDQKWQAAGYERTQGCGHTVSTVLAGAAAKLAFASGVNMGWRGKG